jgi:hypothetical protein
LKETCTSVRKNSRIGGLFDALAGKLQPCLLKNPWKNRESDNQGLEKRPASAMQGPLHSRIRACRLGARNAAESGAALAICSGCTEFVARPGIEL